MDWLTYIQKQRLSCLSCLAYLLIYSNITHSQAYLATQRTIFVLISIVVLVFYVQSSIIQELSYRKQIARQV